MSNTITLHTADGKPLELEPVAMLCLGADEYAVLAPVGQESGQKQAYVFSVTKGADGEASLRIVTDPDVLNAVFREYCALEQRKFAAKREGTVS